MAARGEDFTLDIEGVERLTCTSKSIAPEAACTSVQLHLQVTPDRFADVWNAAQAVTAAQIALGANAPFLSAANCGASPGPRCSSSPPTPARPSSRPRESGRAPGSGNGG
ncbi:Glutamate--cysteine ligase OS=Streptomyces tendae OX=1932 GN=GUR47_30485 PE=4 SV=1 [Streptomyces tendae]